MTSLNRNEKVTCDNFGTQTPKPNLPRHKKGSSAGTFYFIQCPTFSTKSQNDLNCQFAKKHSAPKSDITFECRSFYQEFLSLYARRQHKITHHGFRSETTSVNLDDIIIEVDDMNREEELRSCQHFFVDSELARARHKVFIYAIRNLNATINHETLDHFFNNLKCG